MNEPEIFLFANHLAIEPDGWVQLAPYGDFPNADSNGRKVMQRFQRPDAEALVKEFNERAGQPQRVLGLPWYVGHPDHPAFRGKPGHTDWGAKGRIKQLEARADGLYANVKFNSVGHQLIADETYHGHSVNWKAVPRGSERGTPIFRPISLQSVGFTNNPQIPARPVTLPNEEQDPAAPISNSQTTNQRKTMNRIAINLANGAQQVNLDDPSQVSDALHQLIEKEMRASGCDYPTAWQRVGSTDEGKALFSKMTRSDVNRYDENSPQAKEERDAMARLRSQSPSGAPGAVDTDMAKAMRETQALTKEDFPQGSPGALPIAKGKVYPRGFTHPGIVTLRAHGANI